MHKAINRYKLISQIKSATERLFHLTYSIQDAAQGSQSLLVRAGQTNYALLIKSQKMLPIVIHGDWLDSREIWVAESGEDIAQTHVTLDEDHPFIEFQGKQPQTENVFIVIPNIVNVDFVENPIDESVLKASNRLCKQLDDHEAVTLDLCEHCDAIDINQSIIKNRLCRNYVRSINHLSTPTIQIAFTKYLEQELSTSRLVSYKRDKLQQQWNESEREPDAMDQYRQIKSWWKARNLSES